RVEGGVFVDCGDRGNRVPDESDFFDAQRVFVLADRKDSVRYWQIFAGYDCNHPRKLQRSGDIYAFDQSVRHWTSQHFGKEHARKDDVVGEAGLPGALGACVDLTQGFADDFFAVVAVAFIHKMTVEMDARPFRLKSNPTPKARTNHQPPKGVAE